MTTKYRVLKACTCREYFLKKMNYFKDKEGFCREEAKTS